MVNNDKPNLDQKKISSDNLKQSNLSHLFKGAHEFGSHVLLLFSSPESA